MGYTQDYLDEASEIINLLDIESIERLVDALVFLRDKSCGRLFLLGVGGSAANCSHAVNDFRKLCGIEAYAPTDNVSELTARTNDDGWDSTFVEWLKVSRLGLNDMILVLSVGGGSIETGVSLNLVEAVRYAKNVGACVAGIVGRYDGYTAEVADTRVVVPEVNPETITPHAESFQAVIWHLIASHPALKYVPIELGRG